MEERQEQDSGELHPDLLGQRDAARELRPALRQWVSRGEPVDVRAPDGTYHSENRHDEGEAKYRGTKGFRYPRRTEEHQSQVGGREHPPRLRGVLHGGVGGAATKDALGLEAAEDLGELGLTLHLLHELGRNRVPRSPSPFEHREQRRRQGRELPGTAARTVKGIPGTAILALDLQPWAYEPAFRHRHRGAHGGRRRWASETRRVTDGLVPGQGMSRASEALHECPTGAGSEIPPPSPSHPGEADASTGIRTSG